jgi:hypothetical protein
MTMAWRWFGVAALGLLTSCGSGRPGERTSPPGGGATCEASVVSWATQCAARQRVEIAGVQCPEADVALLDLRGDPELRVELRRGAERSFRQVGPWGVSPVGNFADWNQVAPSMRERFDKVTACVRSDDRVGGGGSVRSSRQRPVVLDVPTVGNSIPWLMLGALACVLASLWPVRRSVTWRRRALFGGAMALGALVLRSLLLPELFFHQNGQGPLWVSVVVSPQYHPYGPGYRALFGWLRWFTRDPDRGVFFAQGVLASLAVPGVAYIARRLGASRALAGALAFAVAIDPMLGRLSRSESYYGLGASLLFLATALLASAITSLRIRSAGFLLPVIAAALVIAQHALVHPVGWLAASLCPAVLLLGPGHWRRRVRRTAAATAVVVAVVALVAAPSMWSVLHSPFGAQWAGGGDRFEGFARLRHLKALLPYALVLAVAMVAGARSLLRGALLVLVFAPSLVALLVADAVGFGAATGWVHQAYLRLYAPVAVVIAASALLRLPRSRPQHMALAAGVALLSLAVSWRAWPAWTKAPTDALEQNVARRWRREITSGQVVYLERSGKRVLMLPFYRDAAYAGPSPLILRVGEFAEDITRMGRRPFYVRTSLCSTPEGREFCDRIEQRYRMTRLHEVELPAVPSMPGLGYDRPTVRVGLYQVTGTTSGAAAP